MFVLPIFLLIAHSLGTHAVITTSLGQSPRCTDGQPPFEPRDSLTFCQQHSGFSCCTDDEPIRESYDQIRTQVLKENTDNAGINSRCFQFLKDILCVQCSAFQGYVYGDDDPFPGLCEPFCLDLFASCREIIPFLLSDGEGKRTTQLRESLDTAETFCAQVSRGIDPVFCYPELTTNGNLTAKLTESYRRDEEGCLCLQPFADGLENPLLFRSPPDDEDERVFVAEQNGRVHIYGKNGTKTGLIFADLSHLVLSPETKGDERGLLGLAFHPDYQNNGKLYLYFFLEHEGQHKTRLSEFSVHPTNSNKIDIFSERVLLEVVQPYARENGGELLFGTDGYLYVFLGDGGGGLQHDFPQNKSVLLGKVLRIDIDTKTEDKPYGIPTDNPFVDEDGARPEIYAYGVRNMWRCDVDDGDSETGYGKGRILCGEVGDSRFEEINIVKKGGNYGWNLKEGQECVAASDDCDERLGESQVSPIHQYSHSPGGQAAVIGGHVYRGCTYPNMQGLYFFGDFVSGDVYRLKEDSNTGQWKSDRVEMCAQETCGYDLVNRHGPNIMSFGEDADGELYLLTIDMAHPDPASGEIFKFVDPRRRTDPLTQQDCRRKRSTKPFSNGGSSHETGVIFILSLFLTVWSYFLHCPISSSYRSSSSS